MPVLSDTTTTKVYNCFIPLSFPPVVLFLMKVGGDVSLKRELMQILLMDEEKRMQLSET
jgi:hypothetical protein